MNNSNGNAQEMDYTIHLSARDFEHQDLFKVGVNEPADCIQTNGNVRISTTDARIQLGQTDLRQQDHRTEIRFQSSRAAKRMNDGQLQTATIIDTKSVPIVKKNNIKTTFQSTL